MKATLVAALMGVHVVAFAVDESRLADAIYHAEGGKKASRPYGIKSIPVRNKDHARQVCLNTIRRAKREWDGRGDFIAWLGKRYCPAEVDPTGHRNWVRNTRHFYERPRITR